MWRWTLLLQNSTHKTCFMTLSEVYLLLQNTFSPRKLCSFFNHTLMHFRYSTQEPFHFKNWMLRTVTYILHFANRGLTSVSLLFLVSPVQRVVLLLAYIPQVLQSCLKERNCARPKRPDVTQFICFTKWQILLPKKSLFGRRVLWDPSHRSLFFFFLLLIFIDLYLCDDSISRKTQSDLMVFE